MTANVAPSAGTTPKSGLVSLRIPISLHEQLCELADLEGVSLNYFIGQVVAHGLNSTWFTGVKARVKLNGSAVSAVIPGLQDTQVIPSLPGADPLAAPQAW